MVKLHGEVIATEDLTAEDKLRMYALMERHYENVNINTFMDDLGEKDWVVLLRESNKRIQGFTTLMAINLDCHNKRVKGVFSGDTIISKEYWGSTELHKVWVRFVMQIASRNKDTLFYWLLISKGYKTYRFLSTYFKEFYPRFDCSTPEFEKRLMDSFGEYKYPGFYDSHRGIVRLEAQKDYLKAGVADISERRLKDPHIEFFVRQNPEYGKGDELVCIARLSEENLKPFVLNHFLGSV